MSDDIRTPMKAALWEEAKGKLRALVAVQGSYTSTNTDRTERWAALHAVVDKFIAEVEDNGLEE